MSRLTKCDAVLRALGVLLIAAALLKGHQLMTEPVANRDIWSYRPFLIFQIESELALGIWLLSGLFRRLAWLISLMCFSLFCCVTLYRAMTGAISCGCFGKVQINPWLTLVLVDLPAVVALIAFKPIRAISNLRCSANTIMRASNLLCRALNRTPFSIKAVIMHSHFIFVLRKILLPIPIRTLQGTLLVVVMILITTTPVLSIAKPAKATSTYEVLEPWTWIGKELPIFDHIDIASRLKGGNWLVVLYHHDCPDCRIIIPKYKQMAIDIQDSGDYLHIALIEVPPYRADPPRQDVPWISGKMDDSKKWFVLTPVPMLIVNGRIQKVYDRKIPPNFTRVFGDLVDMNDVFDTYSSQAK